MCGAYASGDALGATSMPSFANASLTSGIASAFAISACRRATIAGGVPAGAASPIQVVKRKPGNPCSAIVGTSGSSAIRCAPVVPSAFSLPPWMCASGVWTTSIIRWMRPASRSVTAAEAPLYGTWTMSMPARDLKSSPARCSVLPMPAEPKLSLPGFAFA
jgi:hypothetical protein